MPVYLDTHDPEIDLIPGTTKSDIVGFLYTHPEYGYKPAEVRDRLDIPHGTATTTLKRLQEAGDLGKTRDGYYHALENREDLRRYAASLDQLDSMFGHPRREQSPGEHEADASETSNDSDLESELDELEADLDK